jgi:hypothetical protein
MINRGALAQYSEVDMLLGAPLTDFSGNTIRKLELDPQGHLALRRKPLIRRLHCSFRRKLRKWSFCFEERREGVAAAR